MKHFFLLALLVAGTAAAAETNLGELDLGGVTQGWGQPQADMAVDGVPLQVAGQSFERGIGTHAPAAWKLPLAGKATEFRAKVGVQEYPDNPGAGSVEFIVRGDGRELWRSGVMRGKDAAKDVRVNLASVNELSLEVTEGGDNNSSDHADWLDAVITHDGAPLPLRPAESLAPDEPGDPPNAPAEVIWEKDSGGLHLQYDGRIIFSGAAVGAQVTSVVTRVKQAVTQTIILTGKGLSLASIVTGGPETLVAETRGPAQAAFPLVRTTHGGPSRNRRNNAIYDRTRDWMLEGASFIVPGPGSSFLFSTEGDEIKITFKPRFYQRHKNIAHFRPWTYKIREDSITGWSSWWAYMKNFRQSDLEQLLAVWKEKRLAEYGYRFIQIDDCYQGGGDAGHHALPSAQGLCGNPDTWLKWRDNFPAGMAGYVDAVKKAGFEPGVWLAASYGDMDVVAQHPDWFIRGADGKAFIGPWIGYAIDASNADALKTLVRPTYRGFKDAGFTYVKIDALRHYLYDNLHHNPKYPAAEVFRRYVGAAREELGPGTFILSCWGVLPESVGLADACRIGGDGYGPVTMQQYNSWNGIVWRNDPDHCDVYPKFKPATVGNVTRLADASAAPADTIIRPALASIAGCMLMLSDKPEVYRDEANLAGLRRAAPVLFSVPGQLYDFDESKTRNLIRTPRTAITSGRDPSPIDANQYGPVCPWWLNEFNLSVGSWDVLHRLNWTDRGADKIAVKFADLGLEPDTVYLVYEFWSRTFLGPCTGSVELPALPPMGMGSYAIRRQVDHPQLVSTSRHLSQGAVDLKSIVWKDNMLSGRSRVIAGDRYELVVHVPAGTALKAAKFGDKAAETTTEGRILRAAFTPESTGEIEWKIQF